MGFCASLLMGLFGSTPRAIVPSEVPRRTETRLRMLEASRSQPRYFNRLAVLIPPAVLFGLRTLALKTVTVRSRPKAVLDEILINGVKITETEVGASGGTRPDSDVS